MSGLAVASATVAGFCGAEPLVSLVELSIYAVNTIRGVDLEDSVLFVACNPVRDHPASAVELGEVNLVDLDVVFLVFEVVSEDVVSPYSAHLLEARDEDLAAGDPA